jgi:hypothetical protein
MSEGNYIDAMADAIRAQTPRDLVPEDADDPRSLFRLYALLALTVGEAVTTREVHDAWAVWMLERGEQHESIVPFGQLDAEVQAEDEPFVKAIRAAVTRGEASN